ncbi:586_t:CDS:2 [Paraglomus occultum]|uniref:586_t:CDS:1 n=1 Tax=Paraglomus occultum TaxID=144539 RepID=A0A9N9FX08_9GLOM|nr:586_t:CDS:2 [Paraglomus occultum]
MDYGTIFQQIEEACADMQVPATRHAGEQVLLQFRQTSGNLAACQYILGMIAQVRRVQKIGKIRTLIMVDQKRLR